ncbi:CPBP family intramembrane glutamic endopeptidase [Telluria beijingensis]|uniref:CPBP family intramembrane glutamic endopeptidase n=1 Tax=Telluria beijingensis TaxID=3068633 RepID=UPI0027956C60|nr:CPBP family intramembrane glutamic endopeptidase [Massilia sp. REN29]
MTPDILITFGLLATTILLLWVPVPAIRGTRCWAWCAGLVLACGAGLAAGILDWRAPFAIAAFAALAWGAHAARGAWLRGVLLVSTGLAALLMAMHRVPGFHNPVVLEGYRFSSDTLPFTLYANFDKAVVGIVLVGVFCERIATWDKWAAMLRRIGPVVLSTLAIVLGLALLLGQVRPDLKWTPYSAWFLASNLLITCVAEETFFRGFLLEWLARALRGWRGGVAFAVILTSALFGLAHLGGGVQLALLAAVAGLHYAIAYLRSGRVEGAILTHFALNAVHFIGFSYPALAA